MRTTQEEYRALLERDASAQLALKRAKAAMYLRLTDGPGAMPAQKAWQLIAIDPEIVQLEDAATMAHIDLDVVRAYRGQAPEPEAVAA